MPPLNETILHDHHDSRDSVLAGKQPEPTLSSDYTPPRTFRMVMNFERFHNLRKTAALNFLKIPALAPIEEGGSTDDDDEQRDIPSKASISRQSSLQRRQLLEQRQHSFWQSCVNLLSSRDLDQNRVALQRLLRETTKQSRLHARSAPNSSSSFTASIEPTSHAIVYGGGPMPERLRQLLLTLLSDDVLLQEEASCYSSDEDSVYLSDAEDAKEEDETEKEPEATGKGGGVLHSMALKVVANALEQMLESEHAADALPLDFSDPFLKAVLSTLVATITDNDSATPEVAGQSLKCLRLLHSFEPEIVLPLLQYTLIPYMVQWQHLGKLLQHPLLEQEAELLLVRAGLFQAESRCVRNVALV